MEVKVAVNTSEKRQTTINEMFINIRKRDRMKKLVYKSVITISDSSDNESEAPLSGNGTVAASSALISELETEKPRILAEPFSDDDSLDLSILFANENIPCSTPKKAKKDGKEEELLSSQDSDKTIVYEHDLHAEKTVIEDKTVDILKDVNQTPSTSFNSSPRKRLNVDSSVESKKIKLSIENENPQINLDYLVHFRALLRDILASKHSDLILAEEKNFINDFLNFDDNIQYLLLKLFTRQQKWQNIHKFCGNIKLQLPSQEINNIYNILKSKSFIDTEYNDDDLSQLLNLLSLHEVRDIYKRFKLPRANKSKTQQIQALLNHCNRQATLSIFPIEQLIRKEIEKKLGKCVKLSKAAYNTFLNGYTLATFANPNFDNIYDFFNSVLHLNVVFPQFEVQDFVVFLTRQDFLDFVNARKLIFEAEDAKEKKDSAKLLDIGNRAFHELENIIAQRNQPSPIDNITLIDIPTHIKRFSAESVYTSLLTALSKSLTAKFVERVKEWLEFMVAHMPYSSKIGFWCDQLALIYMKYVKDNRKASELIMDCLQNYRGILSQVVLYDLTQRGLRLCKMRNSNLGEEYFEQIKSIGLKPVNINKIPSRIIDAHARRSNVLGKKRNYSMYSEDGSLHVMSVEDVALNFYKSNDYPKGIHCEGSIIMALFTVLFYDILYNSHVPKTFLLKVQTVPLDMYSASFYTNRKPAIDLRLRQISEQWTREELLQFAANNWLNHSSESAFCVLENYLISEEMVKEFISVIGRHQLSKIFEKVLTDKRISFSGLPDLLLWNPDRRICKFVEVKGEGDTLSTGQKLWLRHLKSIGADAEICHVHSIGSKKKTLAPLDESSPEL